MSVSEVKSHRSTTRLARTSRISIAILGVFAALWFFAAACAPYFSSVLPDNVNTFASQSVCSLNTTDAVYNPHRNQVVVRIPPTNGAGLGSVVAQLRSSAAIATMLGADFTTFGVRSEHDYNTASVLQLDRLDTPLGAGTKICSLGASPNYGRTLELASSWCDNVTLGDAHALELRALWSDCGVILDDRPWDARYDMSKCTWKWVKEVFTKLGLKTRTRGIGLHIRWGDMSLSDYADQNDPLRPERSTPIDVGARSLRKLRECGVQDELSVYMEMHNATMLEGLGEPYRLVDSGDGFDDLLDLASNRVMILDISSWTVLAHQIAEGGITVIPDVDLFGIEWHDNGMNRVLRWNELESMPCSDFSSLLGS